MISEKCVDQLSFRCDETISVLAKDTDNVNFELIGIFSKVEVLGRTCIPFRELCSRKTMATRKFAFNIFINKLKEYD